MTDTPVIHIKIELTSSIFRISSANSSKPYLVVTTKLEIPQTLTLDARGERDSDTVLGYSDSLDFRMEHFAFYDVTTSKPVVHELFPGTCEPDRENLVEIRASKPRVTSMRLNEINPLSHPVNILESGHEYRLSLKPQTIRGWACSLEDLYARRTRIPEDKQAESGYAEFKYPPSVMVILACNDNLVLKVED